MKNHSARDKAIERLVADKLQAEPRLRGPACLDAETVAAYVERNLTPGERSSCETHLAACVRCRDLVAELVRLNEAEVPEAKAVAARARIPEAARTGHFGWAWASSLLVAVIVGGLWYSLKVEPLRRSHQEVAAVKAPENKPAAEVSLGKKNAGGPPVAITKDEAAGVELYKKKTRGATASAKPSPPPVEPPVSPASAASVSKNFADNTRSGAGAQRNESGLAAAKRDLAGPAEGTREKTQAAQGLVESLDAVAGPIAPTQSVAVGPSGGRVTALESESKEARAVSPEDKVAPSATKTLKYAVHKSRAAKPSTAEGESPAAVANSFGGVHQVAASPNAPPGAGGWRVGPAGLIQKADGHGKWVTQPSDVSSDLYDITFATPAVGWAVGQAGTVLCTTDGGATWEKLPAPTTDDLLRVMAASERAARVLTRSGRTLATEDGGRSWTSSPRQ